MNKDRGNNQTIICSNGASIGFFMEKNSEMATMSRAIEPNNIELNMESSNWRKPPLNKPLLNGAMMRNAMMNSEMDQNT